MNLLVESKTYTIYDPGLDIWLKDYLYIGYNLNGCEHIFRSTDQFDGNWFIYIKEEDIEDSVLELSLREQRNRKINKILI